MLREMMPTVSPNFVGQESYLCKLKDFFSAQDLCGFSRRIFVLHGPGGIGKTQICAKFVEMNTSL
jgi:flagellar biosynthesis GTPase FlhF